MCIRPLRQLRIADITNAVGLAAISPFGGAPSSQSLVSGKRTGIEGITAPAPLPHPSAGRFCDRSDQATQTITASVNPDSSGPMQPCRLVAATVMGVTHSYLLHVGSGRGGVQKTTFFQMIANIWVTGTLNLTARWTGENVFVLINRCTMRGIRQEAVIRFTEACFGDIDAPKLGSFDCRGIVGVPE